MLLVQPFYEHWMGRGRQLHLHCNLHYRPSYNMSWGVVASCTCALQSALPPFL